MKATLISVLFLALQITMAWGQPVIDWNAGSVVLSDQSVMVGDIYHPKGFDLIIYKTGEGQIALNASMVQGFRYYDSAANINRKFVSIKRSQGNRFYEVVVGGEVSVVRDFKPFANRANPDEIDSYNYFTFASNSLEPIHQFKRKVFPKLLEQYPEQLEAFVHKEKLAIYEMKSALLIIEKFNRLKQANLLASLN